MHGLLTGGPRARELRVGSMLADTCTYRFRDLAVGPNQWYRFGIGAPPSLVYILVGIGMFTAGTGF